MSIKKFEHSWDSDELEGAVMNFEPSEDVRIEMSITEEDGFGLSANREGYRYLAKFFAEIAEGDFEDGWHTHKDEEFKFSTGAPEFTFCLSNSEIGYKKKD